MATVVLPRFGSASSQSCVLQEPVMFPTRGQRRRKPGSPRSCARECRCSKEIYELQ